MICLLKILFIFVVRTQSFYYEASHHNQTETKGRRTGESSAVNPMPRIGWVRSDLPPLFNQNHFIMRTQNDEGNSPKKLATTANEILNNFATTHAGGNLGRDFLKQMCTASLKSDEDGFRKDIFVLIYEDIDNLLESIEILKETVCISN